jgi:hypothetical protein
MRGFSEEVVPHHVTMEAFGVRVRVCASSAELLGRLEQLVPPSARKVETDLDARRIGVVEEEDGSFCVYSWQNRVCENGTRELAMVVFNDQVQSYVALTAPDRIFVHAGVVARDGRAIVIPGDSFSGKSTLVEALITRGAAYYSDEFAVLDADGLVHPFAKPLTLRRLQLEGLHASGDRTAESLGAVVGEYPLPLGLVVCTYFVPGAVWSPRRLTRGEAALALMSKTVSARYRPEDALKLLSRVVDGVTVLEGERGEADEFAEMLLDGAIA